MFEVKLGTGEILIATSVSENYQQGMDIKNRNTLSIENAQADHTLDYYQELLEAPNALDTIQVLVDGIVQMTVTGYTEIQNVQLRLLSNGDKALTITLMKAINGIDAE